MGIDWPAPSAPDVPSRKIKSAGTVGVQGSRHGDHVIYVVMISESGPKEYPPYMDVVGDVAAAHVPKRFAEIAGKDLRSHGRLLLPDARKCLQSTAQFDGCRDIGPQLRR